MPNINMQYKPSGNTPAERLAQLENFVFALTERLTYCLAHLDSENVSEGILTDSSGESYEKEITDLSVKLSALISGLAKVATSGKYSDLTGAPASLPASDVYPWAKEPEKPEYTCGEIGADPVGAAAAALISAKSYADSIAENKADKSEAVSSFSVLGTIVTYTKADGSSDSFETEDTQYSVSSPETDGLMSAADKKKLDSVTEDRMALWDSSSIDSGKAAGNPVVIDGLQGGVPFPEIAVSGEDISGTELTLNVCGKNLLKYPYYQTTRTVNGVTFTDNGDGTVTANGTAAGGNAIFRASGKWNLPKGKYAMSGCPDGGGSGKYKLGAYNSGVSGEPSISADFGDGTSFELTEETNVGVWCVVFKGAAVNNLVFHPQLEFGSAATAYEPYSGAEYKFTPDSNPYTVPADIRQLEGRNTLYVADSGAQLTVSCCNKSPTLARIYEIINSLITVDSNGDVILNY